MTLYFVITFKIHQADVKTIFRQTPDVCQDPKLEVSHSCHDVIQMSRRKPTRTIRKWPEEAQDTMREDTETKQGSTVDKASRSSQVKPGSQRMVSSCRRFRSHDEPCGRLVPAVVHPLMLSSISSSTPTLCITAPDSCYSLCTTVQRSTEVSLDLDPSTPRIQLRRRMQRSRAVNDQGQEGDQWIKCSVYGWRVCMDKIRRWSRMISAATFDHVFHWNMSVFTNFVTPVLALSQSSLTRLSIWSRTVWVYIDYYSSFLLL